MLSLHKIWVRLINRRFLEQITLPQVAGISRSVSFPGNFEIRRSSGSETSSGSLNCLFRMEFQTLNVPVVVATTVPEVLNYWIYMIRHLDRAAQFLAVIHV
jgi:hypothetical protein